MRVNKQTFFFLCQILGPIIGKITISMNPSIDVESYIAITLHRLITRNTLSTIADLYGIGESITSVIVQECYGAIKYHLKPLTI